MDSVRNILGCCCPWHRPNNAAVQDLPSFSKRVHAHLAKADGKDAKKESETLTGFQDDLALIIDTLARRISGAKSDQDVVCGFTNFNGFTVAVIHVTMQVSTAAFGIAGFVTKGVLQGAFFTAAIFCATGSISMSPAAQLMNRQTNKRYQALLVEHELTPQLEQALRYKQFLNTLKKISLIPNGGSDGSEAEMTKLSDRAEKCRNRYLVLPRDLRNEQAEHKMIRLFIPKLPIHHPIHAKMKELSKNKEPDEKYHELYAECQALVRTAFKLPSDYNLPLFEPLEEEESESDPLLT